MIKSYALKSLYILPSSRLGLLGKNTFSTAHESQKNYSKNLYPLKNMLINQIKKNLSVKFQQQFRKEQVESQYNEFMKPFQQRAEQMFKDPSGDNKKQKQSNQEKKEGGGGEKFNGSFKQILYRSVFIALIIQFLLPQGKGRKTPQDGGKIEAFLNALQNNSKSSMVITVLSLLPNQKVKISLKDSYFAITIDEQSLVSFLNQIQQFQQRTGKYIDLQFIYSDLTDQRGMQIFSKFLGYSFIALFIYFYYKFRSQSMGSINEQMMKLMGVQKFKPIKAESIEIFFRDVAGMHEAKFQVTEFVDFLRVPEKYIEMGAKVPKGALLAGPPGTGKTLLAKACAGEAGVPFYYVSGSDFVEKYAGLGAARVRSLFDQAEKNSPSIVFIDEIDAIGKKRGSGPFSNEERENTLNQLLVRMDGFQTTNKVIVMAATNRKDMLDPALLRPGRFDRTIQISLPNLEERQEILKVHLEKVTFDPSVTNEEFAKKISVITPGFSGAELANICNQAAILAAREDQDFITLNLFEKATERVMAGLEKRNMLTEEQKDLLAVYESGKAVTSWFTEGSDPVIKISILPFSKSGKGYSHSIKDETSLNTKQQLLDKVCCYLSGRAAEEYFKGTVTTHGDNDLQRAKRIITLIVTKFGMSQSLKMIAFPDIDFTRKPYSEKVESQVDAEIRALTEMCQNRVKQLIQKHEDKILLLKEKLLEKQTLTHNCLKQILGDRPAGENKNYEMFLKDQEEQQHKKQESQKTGPSDAGVQPARSQ